MKFCTTCNQEKPLTDFHKHTKKKDGLQSFCKICAKKKDKDYYENNKSKCHAKSAKYVAATKVWIRNIKSSLKCKICGEDHPSCLDFHHLDPNEKDGSISNMTTRSASKAKILDEVSKCIVLCSNCHRKFHDGAITLPD